MPSFWRNLNHRLAVTTISVASLLGAIMMTPAQAYNPLADTDVECLTPDGQGRGWRTGGLTLGFYNQLASRYPTRIPVSLDGLFPGGVNVELDLAFDGPKGQVAVQEKIVGFTFESPIYPDVSESLDLSAGKYYVSGTARIIDDPYSDQPVVRTCTIARKAAFVVSRMKPVIKIVSKKVSRPDAKTGRRSFEIAGVTWSRDRFGRQEAPQTNIKLIDPRTGHRRGTATVGPVAHGNGYRGSFSIVGKTLGRHDKALRLELARGDLMAATALRVNLGKHRLERTKK